MKTILGIKKEKLLFIVITSLILLSILFLPFKNTVESLGLLEVNEPEKMEETEGKYYISKNSEVEGMCKYLSDIEYDRAKSSVGWGSITLDSNLETQYNHGLITLLLNGEKTYFLKGISAHATSTLIYDISEESYDYFSAFVGVDESRGNNGNGVKFAIYTSKDGNEWELKSNVDSKVLKGNSNAEFVEVALGDAKFLKLEADQYGSNSSDHSVYANAKLYKSGYEEKRAEDVDFIKTVEEYDKDLKDKTLDEQLTEQNELILLKRTFVNNVGYNLLQAIVNQDEDYKDAVEWLMGDIKNLRLYVLGGEPDGGSYYNSIKELSRLYKTYKGDFEDPTPTNNKWCPGLTRGEVFKKMAISLSLTHATKVGYWAQIDHPSNRSDSVERYRIYKELYTGGKFIVARNVSEDGKTITPKLKEDGVTPVQDHTPWFEALTVEEMRYVMNNITDDEELIWLNAYTQKRIDANPGQEEKYLQPHTYIAYIWPNFEDPIFHDQSEAAKKHWDEWFEGIFSIYGVTYSTETDHVYKAWMSMRNDVKETGAVCGGISKLGCHIRAAHGTPASVVGQPGHAAIIYYRKDAEGRGYWTLDNDVSGWAQSGKSEKMGTRMPLGWGSDSYVSGYAATYMMLSQEALNDNANYEKSEKIIMTADLYKGNLAKQEEIYKKALEVQKINIDAWWGLINTYKAGNKTEEDYYKLATDLGEALKAFPLPMKNLLDQIAPMFTSVKYSFNFTILETKLLNEGTTYGLTAEGKEDTSKKLDVMQPSITRTVAKYLLGQTDTTLASFSFDGADAGKIVLSSRFDNTGVRWEYSLDGQKTWKEVSFEPDKPHKWQLSRQEIASITAESDICINIVGATRSEANIYKIDIEEQQPLENVYANDLENRLIGVNLNTDWRYIDPKTHESSEWVSYGVQSPDLTGEKYIQVRQKPTGTKLSSSESEIYIFTPNTEEEDRKYISVSDMEIYSQNTQSEDSARPHYAENMIDGNKNTLWHSNFKYDLTKDDVENAQIIIKLNKPKYVSALEFIEKKYKAGDRDGIKSLIVSVSEDAENWTEAGKIENLDSSTYGDWRIIDFEDSIYAQYVKLDITTYDLFAAISMVNIYEDTTKIDTTKPTASIYYSTKEPTSDYVIARLINPSTEITITNNGGNDTYVFKENGKFTFEFEDKNGNKGSETAEVTWIDRSSPDANVDYNLDAEKRLSIILSSISEDVYLLDQNDNKVSYIEVNENKKVSKISFIDETGEIYKIVELDNDGNITKTTYKNTTGQVSNVDTYVASLTNGELSEEEFLNEFGSPVEVSDAEKEILRRLDKVKTNPLEYTFENSGNYEFKLLDKASNIAYKSIKAEYLEDNKIIASDISYDIANITNQDVVATINPYVIDAKGLVAAKIVNNNAANNFKFEENNYFTFKYKDASDEDDSDLQEHTANVNWIDKTAPTAEVRYSTNEATNGPVTAYLTNESEDIVITNNNMNDQYTFDKNGEFTFEFVDAAGNTGKAVANVDWISEEQQDENEVGDINNDGKITATDLLLVKRHLVAGAKQEWILSEDELKLADINKDNQITATDLILIKKLILKQANEQ